MLRAGWVVGLGKFNQGSPGGCPTCFPSKEPAGSAGQPHRQTGGPTSRSEGGQSHHRGLAGEQPLATASLVHIMMFSLSPPVHLP